VGGIGPPFPYSASARYPTPAHGLRASNIGSIPQRDSPEFTRRSFRVIWRAA